MGYHEPSGGTAFAPAFQVVSNMIVDTTAIAAVFFVTGVLSAQCKQLDLVSLLIPFALVYTHFLRLHFIFFKRRRSQLGDRLGRRTGSRARQRDESARRGNLRRQSGPQYESVVHATNRYAYACMPHSTWPILSVNGMISRCFRVVFMEGSRSTFRLLNSRSLFAKFLSSLVSEFLFCVFWFLFAIGCAFSCAR